MKHCRLAVLFIAFPAILAGQDCGFPKGKNLAPLRVSFFDKDQAPEWRGTTTGGLKLPESWKLSGSNAAPLVFLPRWSAEALPFFCKVEHDWGKKAQIPLKFRLGSVEYVNWLEGRQRGRIGER